MTWLEIVWLFFWRSLAWRQHEQPYRGASKPLPTPAQEGEAAWKESTFRFCLCRRLSQGDEG